MNWFYPHELASFCRCGFMNFASNRNCLRCRVARPKRQLNPGEWECPSWVSLSLSLSLSLSCTHTHTAHIIFQYWLKILLTHGLLSVDVISWITERTWYAWSVIVNAPRKLQQLLSMRSSYGSGLTSGFYQKFKRLGFCVFCPRRDLGCS